MERMAPSARRAAGFSATATASSRSMMTPSAALAKARSIFLSLVAGTKRSERAAFS
jgi:hypothetical protein